MKKVPMSIIIIALTITALFISVMGLYNAQYNKNGISNFLCICNDQSKGSELVGLYDNYSVYTYNLDKAYFVDIKANSIGLSEGLSSKAITIEDMLEHLDKVDSKEIDIYMFENYKMSIKDKICVISPIDIESKGMIKEIQSESN